MASRITSSVRISCGGTTVARLSKGWVHCMSPLSHLRLPRPIDRLHKDHVYANPSVEITEILFAVRRRPSGGLYQRHGGRRRVHDFSAPDGRRHERNSAANASNFVAVLPANVVGSFVYRKQLASVRKHLWFRMVLAAVGGVLVVDLIRTGSGLLAGHPVAAAVCDLVFSAFGPCIRTGSNGTSHFDGAAGSAAISCPKSSLRSWRLFRPRHGHC